MRRRRARVAMGILAASILPVVSVGESSSVAQVAPPPNVLIILTDDQRSGMNVMPFTTTFFEREGTRYPNAFVTVPLCCPSRASLMTGRYAHNHGVVNNQAASNLQHETTLQAYLHGAGYRTGIFGKYLNRWDLTTAPPFFDHWAVYSNVLDGVKFDNPQYGGGIWNVRGNLRRVRVYSTQFVGAKLRRFLRAAEAEDDRPWFAVVAPPAPHAPATPSGRYREARVPSWTGNPATREVDRSDKPPIEGWEHVTFAQASAFRERQLRALLSVDDLVRSGVAAMTELDEDDNTIVLFLSDNGMLWGEHSLAGKTWPYRQSVKVPLFARWTEGAGDGPDTRMVSIADIAPSILDAVGIEPDPSVPMDGRSLLDPSWVRDRVLIEFFATADSRRLPWASLWTPAYQYVEYYDADHAAILAFREYYDLVDDPWQLTNLLGDTDLANDPDPIELAIVAERLARDRRCRGTSCP